MSERGHTLFDTAIGACGVAWGPHGITAIQLPEPTPAETTTRLLRRLGDVPAAPPPAAVGRWIDAIVALMDGAAVDLAEVRLDMDGVPPFHAQVYALTRAIPPGTTRTYGEIAATLGSPGGARAVGQAMGKNPFPIVVPCHRVLAAGGKAGGFSASGGVTTKLRMLAIERGEVPRCGA